MENENDFLRVARHNLKGPVGLIKGYLSFWQNDDYQKFPPEKQKELVNKAIALAEKLNDLINDVFLTIALDDKVFKPSPEPIQIKETIETIYNDVLKPHYEKKGLYFKLEAKDDLPVIQSDKRYLTMVFQKILDNAEKYTDTGGVTVSLQKENGYAIIEIKDTGKGFTEEEKKTLFAKFFHGSLSLYNVKGVIDALNGQISLESTQKQGSKFIIKLAL